MSVDIEEMKAIVSEPQVMPLAADHAVVKLLHNLPNIIAELESLREQVARKPDARRLAEAVVGGIETGIANAAVSRDCLISFITSIIERELGK
jgi:hypothetical protein